MPPSNLPPIEKVDPAVAWQPWEATATDAWSLKWAGHLYRRAALGVSLTDLRTAVTQGVEATVTRLFDGEPGGEARYKLLISLGERVAKKESPDDLRGWWGYCLLYTPQPLREKMTLFWHNHFATSIAKVGRSNVMFAQNRLLRQNALGKFRPFLLDVSKDAAMIAWLDNNSNVKGKANENYAREVMELFSLGVGNYTETDVREAARAFTGWHTDVNGETFQFNAAEHDDGDKVVLGKKGKWNGDDIVRILLDHPQTARFLVRKLYRYFISEAHDPPAALLEPLAEQFRKSDYDIAALMKTILRSKHFFSAYAYRQRLKSPVEFVLDAVRSVTHKTEEQESVKLPPAVLTGHMAAMGQELFAPPNVKGWPHGKSWLNTSTVLVRNNFAQRVAFGRIADGGGNGNMRFGPVPTPPAEEGTSLPPMVGDVPEPDAVYDIADLVRREKLTDPAKVVDFLLDMFLQGDAPPPVRAKLLAFVAEGKPKDKALNRRVREAAHTIMCMPEYQLA
jgi:Protein of unknown function (DUF1800)